MADMATLGLRVDANGAVTALDQFGRKTDQVTGQTQKLEKRTDALSAGMQRLARIAAAGLSFRAFIQNTVEAQRVQAQLEAAVKSTGGAAGYTSGQLQKMASDLQRVSAFGDEAIQSAQALLLTFTSIKGDEFAAATRATLDLATAMGGDLRGAAIQLGKALNDPSVGMTALTRSGVSFSESQKAMVKQMQETGRIAEAQRLILKELEVQFGGSAAAARNTLGGALAALKNSFGDLFEVSQSSSSGVIGALNAVTDAMPGIRSVIDQFFRGWQRSAVDLAFHFQMAMLQMQESIAKTREWFAGLAQDSKIAAVREWGKNLEAQAHAARDGIDTAREALEIWRESEMISIFSGGFGAETGAQLVKRLNTTLGDTESVVKRIAEAAKNLKDAFRFDDGRSQHDRNAVYIAEAIANERARRGAGMATIDHPIHRVPGGRATLERAQETIDAARRAQYEIERREKEMLDRMQGHWGDFFFNVFDKGIASFRDLFKGIKEMFLRMIAEMVAQKVVQKMAGVMAGLMGALAPSTANAQGLGPLSVGHTANLGAGLAGLGVGYGVGSMIGAAGGSSGLGALGGAASGALVGNMIAPGIGAVIGGLTGMVGGLLGAGKAAKEAARQLAELRQAVAASVESYRARVMGDDLAQRIAGAFDEIRGFLMQVDQAYQTSHNNAAQIFARIQSGLSTLAQEIAYFQQTGQTNVGNELRAEYLTIYAQNVEMIKEQYQREQQQFSEDLQVRLLRAQGDETGANRLAMELAQQRERDELFRKFTADGFVDAMEASTMAMLEQVHAAEASREAFNRLASDLNVVQGYRLQNTVFNALTPRDAPTTPAGPTDTRPSTPYPDYPAWSMMTTDAVVQQQQIVQTLAPTPVVGSDVIAGLSVTDANNALVAFTAQVQSATDALRILQVAIVERSKLARLHETNSAITQERIRESITPPREFFDLFRMQQTAMLRDAPISPPSSPRNHDRWIPTGAPSGDLIIITQTPSGREVSREVLKNFRSTAQRKFGDTSRWSGIQSVD